MDVRHEARERFDRLMRVPDRIVEFIGLVLLGSIGLLVMESISPSQPQHDFLMFFWTVQIGIYALCALYFATRFVAAFVITAIAVHRQDRATARGAAGPPEDSLADRRTFRRLLAGS